LAHKLEDGDLLRRIKVLQVLEAMGGGTTKLLYELITHLDPNKFEISLALPPPLPYDPLRPLADPGFPALIREKGFKVETVMLVGGKIAPLADLKATLALYRIMRRNGYDAVHAHSAKGGFTGRLAARLAGVPAIIYTPSGLPFNPFISRHVSLLYLALERFAGLYTDAIIAACESERQQVVRHKLVAQSKVVLLPNPFDSIACKPSVPLAVKRQELGLSPGDPVVGTVARLTRQKGVEFFVEAAAIVIESHPRAQFVLVGDGEFRPQVEAQINDLDIASSFYFLGLRADYLDIMATFDIFAMPSLWEGLPYAPLEAMALGKPIVATDVTGLRDIIRDGVTGRLVPPQDAEALAQAILALLDDKEEAAKLGREAKKSLGQRFDPDRIASQTGKLYREILARKKAHRR
jgi:glycosyltransferase involved in cell wall biosynthesis